MKIAKYGWALLVLLVVLFGANPQGFSSSNKTNAIAGDVRLRRIQEDDIFLLNGEWLFLPHSRLLDANFSSSQTMTATYPHFYLAEESLNGSGVGSYQMTLRNLNPNEHYMLYTSKISSAYTLTVNDRQILFAGKVSRTIKTYQPQYNAMTGIFTSDELGVAVIQIEIANFDDIHGGLSRPIYLAKSDQMVATLNHHQSIELFLLSFLVMSGFFFGLFHLVYEKDRSIIYALILMLLTAVFILLHYDLGWTLWISELSWTWINRAYYASLYLLLPMFILFIQTLPFVYPKRWVIQTAQLSMILIISITITLPNSMYAGVLPFFHYAMVGCFIYASIELLIATLKKHDHAFTMLIANLFALFAYVMTLMTQSMLYLFPFAILSFGIAYSLLIVSRFLLVAKLNQTLEAEVSTDLLTGCKNRFALQKAILASQLSLYEDSHIAVFFMDLNDFKRINDDYSHDVGDAILKAVGSRLKSAMRDWGEVYRYGGDEFVLLVNLSLHKEVKDVYQRIAHHFKQPIMIGRHTFHIRYGIGHSLVKETQSMAKSLSLSDQKMYKNKHESKGTGKHKTD